MKAIVSVVLVVVYAAFSERALAQTYTPGELRATAIVAGAQDRADAIRRQLDAPTLTPRPTLAPTDTPVPTNTSTPSPAPTETTKPTTPAPMDAPTATVVVIVQIVQTIQVTVQAEPSAQRDSSTLDWVYLIIRVAAAIAGMLIVLWAVSKIRRNA